MSEASAAPDPIAAASLWDLAASPDRLRDMATAWRGLQDAAAAAEEIATDAAQRVVQGEYWTGATAREYDAHRLKVNPALVSVATHAGDVALALEELATMIESNQELLRAERDAIADVPTRYEPGLTYYPENDDQAQRVANAIAAATEIRAHVDEQLVASQAVFAAAGAALDRIAQTWQPRTIRLLNLNIGSGNDRWPVGKPGVDPGEVDRLAELIAAQNPDVVTLQEVFEEDLDNLVAHLNEATGANWIVRFDEASEKDRWTSVFNVGYNEPFGNAVLVRTGDTISGVGNTRGYDLRGPEGEWLDPPHIPSPGIPPSPSDPPPSGGRQLPDAEDRAAIEVEVRFTPR